MHQKVKQVYLIFCLLAVVISTRAQVLTDKRIEVPESDNFSIVSCHPMGERGMVVLGYSLKDKSSPNHYTVVFYDTDLNVISKREVVIPKKQYLSFNYLQDDALYLFFTNQKKGTMTIEKVSPDPSSIFVTSVLIAPKTWMGECFVLGNYAYITSQLRNNDFITRVDLIHGQKELLKFGNGPNSGVSIQNIELSPDKGSLQIQYQDCSSRKPCTVFLRLYDKQGNQTREFKIEPDADKAIASISATAMEDGSYIVSGTFSTGSVYTGLYGRTDGFFFARYRNGKQEFTKYYRYTDLKNFFSFMSEKKQEKLEKKLERKEKKGKELDLSIRMALHPILLVNGNYTLVGEAYFATYKTETYTTYTNGQPVTQMRNVFDGYQYSHATAVTFDGNGELLYDQILEMWLFYKPFTIKRFVKVYAKDDHIALVFVNGPDIKSVTFKGNEIEQEREVGKIDSGNEGDKIRISDSEMDHWYDRHFVIYGYQTIQNKDDPNIFNKRSVYFIQKVTYGI
ncbi:MAG: hypothetical protein KDD36_03160 [Flavobacteriales bacterium]|nr:hypothetical protein [Flavobacteriales bacterium]